MNDLDLSFVGESFQTLVELVFSIRGLILFGIGLIFVIGLGIIIAISIT